MNKEQAKQLKNGDKILIEVIFDQIDDDGDAVIEYTNSVSDYECGFIATKHVVGAVIETQPNKPKYDPCRPFKQGDEVRVLKERHGRKMPVYGAICPGEIYTVSEDEKDGDVMLRTSNFGHDCISWDWLELVTPVEELEPYCVNEYTDYFGVDKGEEELCLYWKDQHPHAKEAAEAECARLNAEHRKDQK